MNISFIKKNAEGEKLHIQKLSFWNFGIGRSSCPEMFCKKSVLKHFAEFKSTDRFLQKIRLSHFPQNVGPNETPGGFLQS